MTKTLRNILATGAAALAMAGCNSKTPSVESISGKFRGYYAEVRWRDGEPWRSTILSSSSHIVLGYIPDVSMDSSEMYIDDVRIDEGAVLGPMDSSRLPGIKKMPIAAYAVPESLEVACESLFAQSARGGKR